MVELASETDFVSKNNEFYNLAYDVAMHVAATNPTYLVAEDVPPAERQKVSEVFAAEAKDKPALVREKIIAGKLDAFFRERTLFDQPFVKNGDLTIKNLIESAIQKFGEKIQIVRFVRFSSSDR
jgi:elongation factor Ts